ncbi:MAG: LicD family protein [Candidatus Omnitrophica bacterium]|nr:LicD family protein [Candidatus Omnitrophota bacterium]
MSAALKSWLSKKIRRGTRLWGLLHSAYMLFSGNDWLEIRGRLRRTRQKKMMRVHAREFLEEILGVCGGLDMRPFLLRGTLLGYCREDGFLKHDYDIDLGLMEPDFRKVGKLKTALEEKGFVTYRDNRYAGPLKKIGERFLVKFIKPEWDLWVDFDFLYPWDGVVAYIEDTRYEYLYRKKELKREKTRADGVIGYALVYPQDLFDTWARIQFLGLDAWIPADAERYLELTYGEWRVKKSKDRTLYQNMKAVSYDRIAGKPVYLDLTHGRF